MDPLDPYVKVKAATALARKKLGMRYRMAVVPLDASPVRGSHGRLPASDDDGPLLICSTPRAVGDRVAATDVKTTPAPTRRTRLNAPPGNPPRSDY